MEYVDLVLCKRPDRGGLYLFEAPAYSMLEPGDEVVVETIKGPRRADVQNSCMVREKSDAYECLVMATGATLPLKRVLSKVDYIPMNYTEGTDDA